MEYLHTKWKVLSCKSKIHVDQLSFYMLMEPVGCQLQSNAAVIFPAAWKTSHTSQSNRMAPNGEGTCRWKGDSLNCIYFEFFFGNSSQWSYWQMSSLTFDQTSGSTNLLLKRVETSSCWREHCYSSQADCKQGFWLGQELCQQRVTCILCHSW